MTTAETTTIPRCLIRRNHRWKNPSGTWNSANVQLQDGFPKEYSKVFFGICWTQPTKDGGGAKTPATIKNMARKPPKPPQIPNNSFWECWSGLIQIPDPTPASTNTDLVENPVGNPWKNRGVGSSFSSPSKAAAIWGRGTTGEAGRGFHSRETTDGYGIAAGLSRKVHARKNSE